MVKRTKEKICNVCKLPLTICRCDVKLKEKEMDEMYDNKKDAVSHKFNFMNETVFHDALFYSKPQFINIYQKNFNMSKLECSILWNGIRENVTRYELNSGSIDMVESDLAHKINLDKKTKKELNANFCKGCYFNDNSNCKLHSQDLIADMKKNLTCRFRRTTEDSANKLIGKLKEEK